MVQSKPEFHGLGTHLHIKFLKIGKACTNMLVAVYLSDNDGVQLKQTKINLLLGGETAKH